MTGELAYVRGCKVKELRGEGRQNVSSILNSNQVFPECEKKLHKLNLGCINLQ
jgi:hypothetical protein